MLIEQIDKNKIPKHIAIIMDGNGRWAKQRNQERVYGHQKGAEAARNVTRAACEVGLEYLTIYAFSKENWKRPQSEVDSLMELLVRGITENLDEFNSLNIRLKIIGDLERLPENVQKTVQKAIDTTKSNTGLTLVVALNYGSRWEIIEAVKSIANQVKTNQITVDEIDEKLFSDNLQTREIPDPDFMIRTSGEYRISNFLLWQISYAEFYFSEKFWPDFGKNELYEAIIDYQSRERRYGKISSQLKKH